MSPLTWTYDVATYETQSSGMEPPYMSLRDLRTGFRDELQRRQVGEVIRDRLADNRVEDECRYLLRFCWQLSMTYQEVTMRELREHVTETKLHVIEGLVQAIRESPAEIDDWILATENGWPIIQ
jgi:hypothetical protein